MTTRQQLEQAIAAQESLRGTIDDAILDATLGALRAQLATLAPPPEIESRRAQATILFLDLAGHTELIQGRDPEEIMEIIDRALQRLSEPIGRHGGRIVRYQGDGYKAVFGLPTARENDPDSAILAALDTLAEAGAIAAELAVERGLPGFQARIGIDTGLVLIGGGTEGEDAVTGLPVNLAARLESAAAPGTILISRHTYQHVRGVFDLTALPPIEAKGFAEPVAVYRVLRRKPRSFRTRRRGVEGVETRMIGRDAELGALQEMFTALVTQGRGGSALVVGEAGVGKSRLLYEFENWGDLQPDNVQLYRGRARLETQRLPYGLLRDVFVFRCGIHDDDNAATVRAKFVAGFHGVLGEEGEVTAKAHLVGHLLGYDFSNSPHVRPLLGDTRQLRNQAQFYLAEYFRAAAARMPVLLLLEDLHWADDSSLDAVAALLTALQRHPVMLLGAARPALYERRPGWLEDRPDHRRVDVALLDEDASGRLVAEIMQRAEAVPPRLQRLIVERAEGNPFYVEELIKMLIDEGVIFTGEGTWRVAADRLADIHVPPTLTGILQARLDGLPAEERATLQRASVVGRLFWDAAVDFIAGGSDALHALWPTLQRRELVFRREDTSFEGTNEYLFKHALLRDVTYESVLKRLRRDYHHRAAEWLILVAGDRVDEYADQIAAHFTAAGDTPAEANWQTRAGLQAAHRYAAPEAVRAFSRALELTPDDDHAGRYKLLAERLKMADLLGDRPAQLADIEALKRLATALGDQRRQAEALLEETRYHQITGAYENASAVGERALLLAEEAGDIALQARAQSAQGSAQMFLGDYDAARAYLERSLPLARQSGNRRTEVEALRTLGILLQEQGDFVGQFSYFEAALALAHELGDRVAERRALNSLGVAVQGVGRYEEAMGYYEGSLTIARAIGDRVGEGTVLGNMGILANHLGDYARSRALFEEALQIAREADDQTGVNICLLNLGTVITYLGEFDAALPPLEEARRGAEETADRPLMGYVLNGIGYSLVAGRRYEAAVPVLQQGCELRLELGQAHLAIETRAFLAEALAATGQPAAAMTEAEVVLDFLVDGQLEELEDTLRVLLAVYRTLAAAGDARAAAVLARAHDDLQTAAARLDDDARRAYLENVPWNRAIVALWSESSEQ